MGANDKHEATYGPGPRSIDDAFDAPLIPTDLAAEKERAEERKRAEAIESDLRAWWLDTASREVEPLIAKMFEYGGKGRALDLERIGQKMVDAGALAGPLTGRGNVQTGYLAELGIYFYVEGKMGRWAAAVAEGRPVSDDTLLDIGVYIRMVQRIRATGGWPV